MLRHQIGKKSWTPSVEARVVETKEKVSGSLEELFLLIYISFTFFSYLFPPSLLILGFLLSFTLTSPVRGHFSYRYLKLQAQPKHCQQDWRRH